MPLPLSTRDSATTKTLFLSASLVFEWWINKLLFDVGIRKYYLFMHSQKMVLLRFNRSDKSVDFDLAKHVIVFPTYPTLIVIVYEFITNVTSGIMSWWHVNMWLYKLLWVVFPKEKFIILTLQIRSNLQLKYY